MSVIETCRNQLRAVLGKLTELEMFPPYGENHERDGQMLALVEECRVALRKCYTDSANLRQALDSVWSKEVEIELADLRMALDTMCRRLTVWLANGFNHPVPTASNAPQPWKEEWVKNVGFVWHMVHRLEAIDVGEPSGVVGTLAQEALDVLHQQPRREKAGGNVEGNVGTDGSGKMIRSDTSNGGTRNTPSRKAIAAYRAHRIMGMKQTDVGRRLGVGQWTVSRWCRKVENWIRAGNILPDLDASQAKAVAVDPAVIDMGQRIDKRTPAQRGNRNDKD